MLDDQNERAVKPNTRERVYWSYMSVEFAKESVMPNNPVNKWHGNKTLGFRAKSQARYAVCSWFAYNDLDLKKVKSERIEQTDTQPLSPITLQGFAKIVKLAPLKWACALVVLLQSAVRIGDFFDQLGLLWPMIKEQVDRKTCIIRINTRGMEISREVPWREMGTKLVCLRLYGATTRGATFEYITFLGNDALDLLDRYVKERGEPAKDQRLWDCDKTRLQKKIHVWAIRAQLMQRDKGNTKGGRRYPWHCLTGDAVISGDFKPISECAVGDHIVSKVQGDHVSETFARHYQGQILEIKAAGMLPIHVTPEHPILTVSEIGWHQNFSGPSHTGSSHLYRQLSKPHWKLAQEVIPFRTRGSKHNGGVRGDYVVLPRISSFSRVEEIDLTPYAKNKGNRMRKEKKWLKKKWIERWIAATGQGTIRFPINEETAWLLGLYVAEGSLGGADATGQIAFNLGHHEQDLATRVCQIVTSNLRLKSRVVEERTAKVVVVQSRLLNRALREWCGHRASEKKIPDFILYHANKSICWAFINGYWCGDGCFSSRGVRKNLHQVTALTTSRKLALQLQLLLARLGKHLGIWPTKPTVSVMEGRTIHSRGGYYMRCGLTKQRLKNAFRMNEDRILVRIRSVQARQFDGIVHNLETTSGTYLANNMVVHNCHRIRKLFKTNCVLRGVSEADSEALEGRKPTGVDKVYDERHITNPEVFAAEYLKVEPCLNVLSNPEGVTSKVTATFIKRFEPQSGTKASSNDKGRRNAKR